MTCSVTKVTLSGLWILGFMTCCLCWPTGTNHRKAYNSYESDYAMPLMMGAGAYEANGNQWELAQDPTEYDESLVDYYEPNQRQEPFQFLPSNPEMEALANLLYDTKKDEEVWGQIVRERPETELEELKQLSGYRSGRMGKRARPVASTTSTTAAPSQIKSTVLPITVIAAKNLQLQPKSNMAPSYHGQKEFPLLRPPVQGNKAREGASPVITQRSIGSDKKPSPYDTLRKYLSIEDALKKEAEKRTVSQVGSSRQVKRSFVADADSLTGQLNKLTSPTSS